MCVCIYIYIYGHPPLYVEALFLGIFIMKGSRMLRLCGPAVSCQTPQVEEDQSLGAPNSPKYVLTLGPKSKAFLSKA